MLTSLSKILAYTLLITLVGCVTQPEINTTKNTGKKNLQPNTTKEQEKTVAEKQDHVLSIGESATTEAGKMTLVNTLKVNDSFTTGSFNVKISTISVAEFIPNESAKAVFENKDKATIISIGMEVENTSPETLSFHPNQGTIITQKEQKNAHIFLSDPVGGDFIGEVIKKGKVLFILETPPEQISKVKYVIEPPFSADNLKRIGEKLTLEFELN
jgi:hypothetical protein